MKCMVITSQMYSHYKSSYIQFLTLGGSHDHLYKLSKFPFLVGHMTHLSKHLIPLSVSTSKGKDVVRISLSPQAPWATLPLDVHLDFSHTCSSCGFREQTTEKLYFTSTGGHNTEKKIVYVGQARLWVVQSQKCPQIPPPLQQPMGWFCLMFSICMRHPLCPLQISLFSRSHDLIMSSIKFSFFGQLHDLII